MITECYKFKHPTYESAKKEIAHKISRNKLSLRIYRCPTCELWHVTKQKYVKSVNTKNKIRKTQGYSG